MLLGGCVELGVITDGGSISRGRPSQGFLIDGPRLPDSGEGFATVATWRERGNRYGTDEMVDLITGVGRQLAATVKGPRLIVADLSKRGGGEARKWHRSHQTGRDVDLLYFMRDAEGAPIEADAMRPVGPDLKAKDGSGHAIDVPRTWALVKALVTAPEATVQWVFVYEPIALRLLEHAITTGEPEGLIAKARLAMKQPGDSAPHNDHVHVRIYCSDRDKSYGCVDFGPMELWAMREAERAANGGQPMIVASLVTGVTGAASSGISEALVTAPATAATTGAAPTSVAVVSAPRDLTALGRMLRTPIRRWR